MNPYKAVRKVLLGAGYTLVALIALVALAAFTAALWSYFGAWALTWPIVLPVGITLGSLLFGLIALPFEELAKWWRRREREWGAG